LHSFGERQREIHGPPLHAYGELTVGAFVLVNTYMLQLAKPIETFGFAIQGLAQGAGMLERMLQLFRELREPESFTTVKRKYLSCGEGIVVFDEVSVAYRPGRPVLKRVSFRIESGCTLGLVGASGSGKSTVMRVLTGLIEPDSGTILLDGIPISAIPLSDLRRSIAVVPQDTLLLNDTVRNNIVFGRPGATDEEIESAVRIAQLQDFVVALPEGYETVVGERGVRMSGGERQRIAIARAVLKNPWMYVFDEATSSLDGETEGEILCALRKIASSTTTLMIAHRLATVAHADEIVVLEDGEVVERGTHTGLLGYGGRYAALWGSQREGAAA
jgi:ABC-type multidrug transport system fused ATPase/permease subunit